MLGQILSTALSGLNAQSRVIEARSSNITNIRTDGSGPGITDGAKSAYTPLDVALTTVTGKNGENSGVRADVLPRNPSTSTLYSPDSLLADDNGLITTPNISLDDEIIGIIQATNAYKANAAVIKTTNELSDELLNILE